METAEVSKPLLFLEQSMRALIIHVNYRLLTYVTEGQVGLGDHLSWS